MATNNAALHPIDLERLFADQHYAVTIPLDAKISEDKRVFALNTSDPNPAASAVAADTWHWAQMTPGGVGPRVPLLRFAAGADGLVWPNIMHACLTAGAALLLKNNFSEVEQYGFVFDPREAGLVRHFGVYAVVK